MVTFCLKCCFWRQYLLHLIVESIVYLSFKCSLFIALLFCFVYQFIFILNLIDECSLISWFELFVIDFLCICTLKAKISFPIWILYAIISIFTTQLPHLWWIKLWIRILRLYLQRIIHRPSLILPFPTYLNSNRCIKVCFVSWNSLLREAFLFAFVLIFVDVKCLVVKVILSVCM